MSIKTRHSLLLLLTAVIWGLAFVSQTKGMEAMSPVTFHGVRNLIGTVTLLVYIFITRSIRRKQRIADGETNAKLFDDVDWKLTIRAGVLIGIAFTVAGTLQQVGLGYTNVGKCGFITALYIIFVPIFGIFFKKKPGIQVLFAAVLAAVGMYFLCMTGGFYIQFGDFLVFLCAIGFAIQILLVDRFTDRCDGAILACMEFLICGVIDTTAAIILDHPTFAQLGEGIGALLYAGVLSCGVAYTLQIVAQKGVNPTVAALIMSLESVVATVAAFFAYKIGFVKTDQTLTGRQIAGCIIVFAGVCLAQLPDFKLKRK